MTETSKLSKIPLDHSPLAIVAQGLAEPQSITASYKAFSESIAAASVRTCDDPLRMARVSPTDGRYAAKSKSIAPYVCEAQLARLRIIVETEWFRNLFLHVLPTNFAAGKEKLVIELAERMKALADDLPIEAAIEISKKEDRFKHDVIAMITVVREHLEKELASKVDKDALLELLSMVHLGLTSEDVSSTSHSLILFSTLRDVIKPACENLIQKLREKASEFLDVPDASCPTSSLGSRYGAYADRIDFLSKKVVAPDYLAVKFSGATGTHAAMGVVAADGFDVMHAASSFVAAIAPELVYLKVTAQINPHDDLALWCGQVDLLRTALQEMCWEIWEDSGRDIVVDGELVKLLSITPDGDQSGSSAMPQKIQVILVENGIGSASCVGGLVGEFGKAINVNRLQRELSDSRIIREIFGVVLPALFQTLGNIATDVPKLQVNQKCRVQNFESDQSHAFTACTNSSSEVQSTIEKIKLLVGHFCSAAQRLADSPFLARTHNQPASPTTFGKELRVFAQRLEYLTAVLSKDLFGRPSIHDWNPAEVVPVAHGILTQFFDDLRIYVTQRNGAVTVAASREFGAESLMNPQRCAQMALENPNTIGALLDSVEVSSELATRELEAHYESLGEAVQTVLRRYGVWDAYERVKKVTRGATMDRSAYQTMVKDLLSEGPVDTLVPTNVQDWLLNLRPGQFTGAAGLLARVPN